METENRTQINLTGEDLGKMCMEYSAKDIKKLFPGKTTIVHELRDRLKGFPGQKEWILEFIIWEGVCVGGVNQTNATLSLKVEFKEEEMVSLMKKYIMKTKKKKQPEDRYIIENVNWNIPENSPDLFWDKNKVVSFDFYLQKKKEMAEA